jgi:excisionase family DNA binding protein
VTDRLLTVDEVAAVLVVSPTTVKRLTRSGELPCVRIGRLARYRRADLDRWVVEHLERAQPPGAAGVTAGVQVEGKLWD